MEIPTPMLYPTFEFLSERGVLPNDHLPSNYKDLVKKFYEEGRKKEIEDYVEKAGEFFKDLFGNRSAVLGSELGFE